MYQNHSFWYSKALRVPQQAQYEGVALIIALCLLQGEHSLKTLLELKDMIRKLQTRQAFWWLFEHFWQTILEPVSS